MDLKLFVSITIVFNSLEPCTSWQYFTTFDQLQMISSRKDYMYQHTEYIYGECGERNLKYYTHVHLDSFDVLGKVIVRGWLNIQRIPTCIKLRTYSHTEDWFRSTAFQFQMCVPRITYCHSCHRYKYFYYEWYIPTDMIAGLNYNIYFFGSGESSW